MRSVRSKDERFLGKGRLKAKRRIDLEVDGAQGVEKDRPAGWSKARGRIALEVDGVPGNERPKAERGIYLGLHRGTE